MMLRFCGSEQMPLQKAGRAGDYVHGRENHGEGKPERVEQGRGNHGADTIADAVTQPLPHTKMEPHLAEQGQRLWFCCEQPGADARGQQADRAISLQKPDRLFRQLDIQQPVSQDKPEQHHAQRAELLCPVQYMAEAGRRGLAQELRHVSNPYQPIPAMFAAVGTDQEQMVLP